MAYYGLTVPKVIKIIREANSSISAGDVNEGKREYIVRAEGEIKTFVFIFFILIFIVSFKVSFKV